MLRAVSVKPSGAWSGEVVDTVVLDFDDRHRRRVVMTGVQGRVFLLDLPQAVMLRSGDALLLDSDELIEVLAAPESLLEVRASDATGLARAAWHLGNRHLPVQILTNRLRLRNDHVIEAMLRGLGLAVQAIEAPFDPEGGAYAGSGETGAHHPHTHGHDHHGHDHHDHADHHHHDHPHGHDPSEAPGERVHIDAHPHLRALGGLSETPDQPHPQGNHRHRR
jgi:urease accessory protein